MKPVKIVTLALFVSLAAVISTLEGLIPMPLPGVKLGAANVFALAALVLMGAKEAFSVTILRVLLTWLLTGNLFVLLCGLVGGMLSTTAMALIYTKFRGLFSLPWMSAVGAWAFNIGQVLAAMMFIGDWRVIYYLPPLIIAGTAAGWAVGALAQLLCRRLENLQLFERGDGSQ